MRKYFFIAFFCLLIYSFNSQTLKPTNQLALLKGLVTNFKDKILSNEIIIFYNNKTKTSIKIVTDANGKFQVLVPVNNTYSLKYKTFTADQDYTKMTISDDKEATYEVRIKIDPPKNFILDNVYFDTGKSTLKPTSNKALNDLVEVLKLKSNMFIEIQGHTDNVGTEESNLKLSQDRANAVKNYLVNKGIVNDRITSIGYGQSIPIADNSSEEGKAKNRRTSLKVIKE